MIVALVEGLGDENRVRDASLVAARCLKLLEDIQTVVEDASEAVCASLPSATKILQPKDKHIISSKHFTDSSPGFFPKSEQLYDGKRLLDKYVSDLLVASEYLSQPASTPGILIYQKYFRVVRTPSTGM